MRKLADFSQRCISAVLIVCTSFMFFGCFTTTEAVYSNVATEKTVVLTLVEVSIISHQNNMGVLYYTVDGLYQNSDTGKIEEIGDNFPFSTYSDALLYKNSNLNKFENTITRKETEHKLLKPEEREFSPIKTALAIGLPTLVFCNMSLS